MDMGADLIVQLFGFTSNSNNMKTMKYIEIKLEENLVVNSSTNFIFFLQLVAQSMHLHALNVWYQHL